MALKFREMKLTSLHFDVTFKVSQERVTHFKNIWNKINRKGKVSYLVSAFYEQCFLRSLVRYLLK